MIVKALSKGPTCEEKVRVYFLRLGMYAVRSVPCRYHGINISDIDVWLYSRPSPLSRHRINVDIKNKKTPQAIERIFWTLGLSKSFGLDECIVVTTDRRDDVSTFGASVGVSVLDGNFLPRLDAYDPSRPEIDRLSEEAFRSLIVRDRDLESAEGWYADYVDGKEKLLTALDFSGVNTHLGHCIARCQNIALRSQRNKIACRLLAIHLSHFLITLDFCMKDIVFKPESERMKALDHGFMYGSFGQSGIDRLLTRTDALIRKYSPDSVAVSARIRDGLAADFKNRNYALLRDYFLRSEVARNLFDLAVTCEAIAFGSTAMTSPSEFPAPIKAMIGVLADHAGLDRGKLL
jgi:hypothetical protein